MNPETSKRTRQLTGSLAAIWALLAIGLSIFSLISPRPGPQLPVRTSVIAGMAVVHAMSASAVEAGIEESEGCDSAIDRNCQVRLECSILYEFRPKARCKRL